MLKEILFFIINKKPPVRYAGQPVHHRRCSGEAAVSSSGYANHGGFRQPQSGQAASRPRSKRRIGKPESSGNILRSVRMTGSYRSQLNNPGDSGHKILLHMHQYERARGQSNGSGSKLPKHFHAGAALSQKL